MEEKDLEFVKRFFREFFVDGVTEDYNKKDDKTFFIARVFSVPLDIICKYSDKTNLIEKIKGLAERDDYYKKLLDNNTQGIFVHNRETIQNLNRKGIINCDDPVAILINENCKDKNTTTIHEQMHNFQYQINKESTETFKEIALSEGIAVATSFLYELLPPSRSFKQLKEDYNKRYAGEYLSYQILTIDEAQVHKKICESLGILVSDSSEGITMGSSNSDSKIGISNIKLLLKTKSEYKKGLLSLRGWIIK